MFNNRFTSAICATLLLATATVYANVPVAPGDFTGSRDATNGITGTVDWGGDPGFSLDWNITQSGNTFHYTYTIDVPRKDPSHFILELSDNVTPQNFDSLFSNFELTGTGGSITGPGTFGPGPSNPDIPGDIYGIKIDFSGDSTLPYILEFDSLKAPMWGDFYAKDGRSGGIPATAYNNGFGTDPTLATLDFTNWIAVPDTLVAVPEPQTYLLLGSSLLLGFVLRRRRQANAS